MEKDRGFKVITILALFLAVIGLTLGFSAYTLEIQYIPEEIDDKIEITEGLKYVANSTEIVSANGETSAGKIEDNVWSGIYFDLTGPGTTASVKANIKNISSYNVYLYSLTSKESITCESLNGQTSDYIDNLCKDIYLNIEVQNVPFKFVSTTNLNYYPGNILIAKDSEIEIVVTMVYPETATKPLESFKIKIPDIELKFSTIN